jgi:hypothetical protein
MSIFLLITSALFANPFVGTWDIEDGDPTPESQTMVFKADMKVDTFTYSELAGTGTYSFDGDDGITIDMEGGGASEFTYEFVNDDEWHFYLSPELFYELMPNKEEALDQLQNEEGLTRQEAAAYLMELAAMISSEPLIIGTRLE